MDNGMNPQDIQDAVQTSSLDPSWNLNSVASTADDFRPTTPLLPDEIAWVFDRAVAAEVRPGASLSQLWQFISLPTGRWGGSKGGSCLRHSIRCNTSTTLVA